MRMLPLHRLVEEREYVWMWMTLFIVVRLVQIVFLVWVFSKVVEWGFE